MSRRVCQFTNPVSGQTDYLEPNTVNILRAHCMKHSHIALQFDNIDAEKVVTIRGTDAVAGHSVTIKIDEVMFAHELARIVYGDLSLDNDPWFVRQYDIIAYEIQRRIDHKLWENEIA